MSIPCRKKRAQNHLCILKSFFHRFFHVKYKSPVFLKKLSIKPNPFAAVSKRNRAIPSVIGSSMSDNIYRVYDDLGTMMGELEFDLTLLDMMVSNGKNEKANRYLKEAASEIRHALSDLSDAEFDITTSSDYINYGIEDDSE